MSKIEEVRVDMFKAMKEGNKDTKETLSMLLAALKNKAIDKREDLTEEEEIQVVLKEIKQTKEALEMTPETEIRGVINATLAELGIEAPVSKDKGRIMKVLMPKVKGKADGKLVNDLLTSFMQ